MASTRKTGFSGNSHTRGIHDSNGKRKNGKGCGKTQSAPQPSASAPQQSASAPEPSALKAPETRAIDALRWAAGAADLDHVEFDVIDEASAGTTETPTASQPSTKDIQRWAAKVAEASSKVRRDVAEDLHRAQLAVAARGTVAIAIGTFALFDGGVLSAPAYATYAATYLGFNVLVESLNTVGNSISSFVSSSLSSIVSMSGDPGVNFSDIGDPITHVEAETPMHVGEYGSVPENKGSSVEEAYRANRIEVEQAERAREAAEKAREAAEHAREAAAEQAQEKKKIPWVTVNDWKISSSDSIFRTA